jgi:hypothetical protein
VARDRYDHALGRRIARTTVLPAHSPFGSFSPQPCWFIKWYTGAFAYGAPQWSFPGKHGAPEQTFVHSVLFTEAAEKEVRENIFTPKKKDSSHAVDFYRTSLYLPSWDIVVRASLSRNPGTSVSL